MKLLSLLTTIIININYGSYVDLKSFIACFGLDQSGLKNIFQKYLLFKFHILRGNLSFCTITD